MSAYSSKIPTEIRCEDGGPIMILTPPESLDECGNEALSHTIDNVIEQKRIRILVNLERLAKIGNQTVQILLDGASKAAGRGGDLRLLRPRHAVIRYLKNNKVYEKFRIYEDRGTAINDFLGIMSSARPAATEVEDPTQKPEIRAQAANLSVLETAHILLTNSHMLATLIELLCEKKILTKEDVRILLETGGDQATEGRA